MKALDDAVYAALDATPALRGKVYYGSPLRDTKADFVSYFAIRSGPSPLAGRTTDAREYTYELIAAHRQGVRAEALKEAAEAALVDRKLAVAGWGTSQTLSWEGDLHDLGDLVVDGTVVHFAGCLVKVTVQRPRQ